MINKHKHSIICLQETHQTMAKQQGDLYDGMQMYYSVRKEVNTGGGIVTFIP
jgi:hypothetical protein